MRLETDKLLLRAVRSEDVEPLVTLVKRPDGVERELWVTETKAQSVSDSESEEEQCVQP